MDIIRLLLGNKADPRLTDSDGKTALHKASEGRHAEVVALLLQQDQELSNISDNRGRKPDISDYGQHCPDILQ
jgi:ankyrin repeat protein